MTNKNNKKLNKNKNAQSHKISGIWVDIVGIILILSVPMLYYMCTKTFDSGAIGFGIGKTLSFLFGKCEYVFPILLLYIGFYIIFKNNEIFNKPVNTFNFFKTKSLIGAICLFLAIDALVGVLDLKELALSDNALGFNNGGVIGYYISFVLSKLFGDLLYYFLLVVIIISIILIANFNYKAFREKRNFATISSTKNNLPRAVEHNSFQINTEIGGQTNKEEEILTSSGSKDGGILDSIIDKKPNENKNKTTTKGEFSFNNYKKNIDFKLPPTSILNAPQPKKELDNNENINNIRTIEITLSNFNIQAKVVNVSDGPTVSRYEITLAEGIKVKKITQLADNLAMSLAAINVRIEAPIPGKSAIGIEVPKASPSMVTLREIIEDQTFQKAKGILTFAIGKDVANKAIFADLTKMPHLLIAGATNSGKSVGLNTLITSLLYQMTPDELRFVMIDPKMVELSLYEGIPHLACPVIKDARLAAGALQSVVEEMERRYVLFSEASSRNIESYNSKVDNSEKLPYLIVVIDELADLMLQCSKDVETSINRIAAKARAVGIHLVLATQRPSVDIVTGLIKANIPSRIAFTVATRTDSNVILDRGGAENLIGRGDMLFFPTGAPKPIRVQGCFLSENEINDLVLYLKDQRETDYTLQPTEIEQDNKVSTSNSGTKDDLWFDIVKYVVSSGYCSTSMLQRKFKIGYNRAGILVDALEEAGIVGPLNGAKPRQVLIKQDEMERFLVGDNSENL